MKLHGLSLFSNVGIAEIFLKNLGADVVLANEILRDRTKFYKEVYPNTDVICGDIRSNKIFKELIRKSKKLKIDFIITTPPSDKEIDSVLAYIKSFWSEENYEYQLKLN